VTATRIVDTYLSRLNETDPKRRARLIEQTWLGDGRYIDPMLEAQGHGALGEIVAGVRPSSRLPLPPGQDMLSKRYRFKLATWTVVRERGQPSPTAAKPGVW
jgi:hypothetical protein